MQPGEPDSPNVVYGETRDDFITVVRALSAEQIETVVPCCPAWTVRDVLAHLSGLVAEALSGAPGPLGSDIATARQVDARAGMTAAEICDEWEANADAFDTFACTDPVFGVSLIADLAVHMHDVAEALGLPIDHGSKATTVAAHRYCERLQERVGERMNVGLTVDMGDGDVWPPVGGDAEVRLTLTTTPFEFLRHVTGRRTRAEVAALDWSGDPAELLDQAWVQYGGPLR